MLMHAGLALHNVVELESRPDGGVLLHRFPAALRSELSPLGRMVAQESAGVELRFVTTAQSFRIALGAQPSVLARYEANHQDVVIFRGGYFHAHHRVEPGKINHLQVINFAEPDSFSRIQPQTGRVQGFASTVWRIFLGRCPMIFYGLDTFGVGHQPPATADIPQRRWLAYGSSITSGAAASVHHNAYIYQAARAADMDVLNQGLSGSCRCEPAMADYLAGRQDWDIITLEIGVNMRGAFTPVEFRERLTHLVNLLARHHPCKPVVLLTIFPNAATADKTSDPSDPMVQRETAFNQIIREIAQAGRHPRISLIEGSDILDNFGDLTTDLIHPSDYGHARMGANLGQHLRRIFAARG